MFILPRFSCVVLGRAANEETLGELARFIAVGIRKGGHVEGIGDVEKKGPNGAGHGQALSP